MFGKTQNRRREDASPTPYAKPVHEQRPAPRGAVLIPELVFDRDEAATAISKQSEGVNPEIKAVVTNALYETLNLSQLSTLPLDQARRDIAEIIADIINIRNIRISTREQTVMAKEICQDLLGFGPLDPLLARDDIGDIMVNGEGSVFIELNGLIEKTDIRFNSEKHLTEICQRLARQTGRHVDKASPICDARLEDGSRGQCHPAAALGQRPFSHHSEVQERPPRSARPCRQRYNLACRRPHPRYYCGVSM